MTEPTEIPEEEMTTEKAIKILKDLLVQQPLLMITDLGRAIACGINALEEQP